MRSRTLDRRTFRPVQQAELNSALVRDTTHQPVERVYLPDQMPFAEPAYSRIAAHLTDRRKPMGYERRSSSDARRSRSRLDTGVPATDDDDVKT